MDHITRAQQALQALAVPGYQPRTDDVVVDLDTGIVGKVSVLHADGRLILERGRNDPDTELGSDATAGRTAAATPDMTFWEVDIDFQMNGEIYGEERFRVVAPDEDAATALAERLAESSTYDDDRLPDRSFGVSVMKDDNFGADLAADAPSPSFGR